MALSIPKLVCLLAIVVVTTTASSSDVANAIPRMENSILAAHKEVLPTAVSNLVDRHRNLQWILTDFTPDSDPATVCTEYNKRLNVANNTWECSCDRQPDLSVGVKCLESSSTCNSDASVCFMQTISLSMTPQTNQLTGLETCSEYITNLTRFEGSSTILANYSGIVPCVKIDPVAPNDFSSLAGCSATINGAPCQKCEICTDNEPALGISLDCCNTNPDGEQLKVECGGVGGGGAFVPFFETYENGTMETCSSGAFGLLSSSLQFLGLVAVVVAFAVV